VSELLMSDPSTDDPRQACFPPRSGGFHASLPAPARRPPGTPGPWLRKLFRQCATLPG